MSASRQLPLPPPGSAGQTVRRHGRLRCGRLECNLGVVVDMSASGLRVRSRRNPGLRRGQTTLLRFNRIGEPPLEIPALVVWTRRTGIWRFEIGLTVDADVTAEQRAALTGLARAAAMREASGAACHAA